MKKIYVADDEENIRQIIKTFLEKEKYTVETFVSGESLYEKFIQKEADLVILDIMMDGKDGLSICSEIRKTSNVPIIIVSAKDSELDKVNGINLGADDYMIKPFSIIELIARINGIFRRLDFVDKELEKVNIESFVLDKKNRECFYYDEKIKLTNLEFNFIYLLVKKKNQAVSREELLKDVWQIDFDIDSRVIDDTLKRLRKKINHTKIKINSVWGYGFKIEWID